MISSIIVTYNPAPDAVRDLVLALLGQVDLVLVVDNGSQNTAAMEFPQDRVIVHRLGENKGIATAQNVGIQIAREHGASHVIFFDQDSQVPAGFVAELAGAFDQLQAAGKPVAATVPVFKDARYGFYYPFVNIDAAGRRTKLNPEGMATPFPVSLAISSGTFTSMEVLDKVGLMRDDFFIDYVDTEWCLRALSKGLVCHAVPAAQMEHAIGDKFVRFLGLHLPVHSPFRRYFRIRNSFYLLHLPWVPRRLAVREVAVAVVHQMILMLRTGQGAAHARTLWRGVRDGLKGKVAP